jgi:hypothetical protein
MLSFYEREAGDIPAGLPPPMAKTLDVSVKEVLGVSQITARKAGRTLNWKNNWKPSTICRGRSSGF